MFMTRWKRRQIHIKLNDMIDLLCGIDRRIDEMQAAIDDLRTAVEEAKGVNQSVVTLVTEMAAKFEEAKDDPAEIQQLAADLRSSTQALAQAVQK